MKSELRVGDEIEVVKVPRENYYFEVGDRAVLTHKDDDGDWYADFAQNGNWCLQPSVGTEFRKIERISIKDDHKVFIDLEIINTCSECGRPVPVKLRHISSYGAGLTVEIDTEPHTCSVFCEVCGDEIVNGKCGCKKE